MNEEEATVGQREYEEVSESKDQLLRMNIIIVAGDGRGYRYGNLRR